MIYLTQMRNIATYVTSDVFYQYVTATMNESEMCSTREFRPYLGTRRKLTCLTTDASEKNKNRCFFFFFGLERV